MKFCIVYRTLTAERRLQQPVGRGEEPFVEDNDDMIPIVFERSRPGTHTAHTADAHGETRTAGALKVRQRACAMVRVRGLE